MFPADVFEPESNAPLTDAEILERAKELRKAKTQERRREQERLAEQKKQIPKPKGVYELVYLDPPWRYDFSNTSNRDIENQYPTMSHEELLSLEIPADENCVMFMWTTAPKLVESIDLLKAWGFVYKSHAIWDKDKIGMGYWFRGQHELLLVATKGDVSPPLPEYRISSVIKQPRGKHSKKPEMLYEYLKKAFPHLSKIEMFARQRVDGFSLWGNENV